MPLLSLGLWQRVPFFVVANVTQSSSVVENVERTTCFVTENVAHQLSQDVLADARLLCSKAAVVREMINITLCMLRISYVFFLLHKLISK